MAKKSPAKKASQQNWAEERLSAKAGGKGKLDGLASRKSLFNHSGIRPTSSTQNANKQGRGAGRSVRAAVSSGGLMASNSSNSAGGTTRVSQSTHEAPEAGKSDSPSGNTAKGHTSFSSMTWGNLDRFALSRYTMGRVSESAFKYIRSELRERLLPSTNRESATEADHVRNILSAVELARMWEKQKVALGVEGRLRGLYISVGRKSEDWARLVINVILEMVKEHTGTLGKRSIQLHSEMTLATGTVSLNERRDVDEYWAMQEKTYDDRSEILELIADLKEARANPGIIEKGTELEKATGTVDFMVVNTPREIGGTEDHFFEGLSKGFTLDRSISILGPSVRGSTFLPIEAKAVTENLVKHLPQMLAQSLICMAKIRRDRMPWVLSNGDEWLFGITTIRGDRWKYVYLRQADSMMGGTECKMRPMEADLRKMMAQAELNMKWLVLWSYADPDDLWRAVMHYRKQRL